MDFYVSWYTGDPFYTEYYEDANILISISSVSQSWTISRFPKLPKKLIIDSGGFRFAQRPDERPTAKSVFYRQLSLLDNADISVILCPLDYPIIDSSLNSNEKDQCITDTIANAYELKNLIVKRNLPANIKSMGIIQGYDSGSLQYCAKEIKDIGFPVYGIGSLVEVRHHEQIIERIQSIFNIIHPSELHVFGISAVPTVKVMAKLGIASFDSARPAKSAMYSEVFYSNPFQRYGIHPKINANIRGRIPSDRRLSKPLPCECPICIIGKSTILGQGKRTHIQNRTIHNYFHLKKTFQELGD